jgi:hypothetical protein
VKLFLILVGAVCDAVARTRAVVRTVLLDGSDPSVVYRCQKPGNSCFTETPQSASSVLLEAVDQVDRLLNRLAVHGLVHGAACAENVILTTTGTYGLLAARFDLGGQDIWVRQPDAIGFFSRS